MEGGGPPSGRELTTSECHLRELLREGQRDAEIAVRLGISTGEVRERVERLAAILGIPREQLRNASTGRGPGAPAADDAARGWQHWSKYLLLGVAGAALLTAGIFLGRLSGRSSSQPSRSAAAAATPPQTLTQNPPRAATPGLMTVGGHLMYNLGPFFGDYGPPGSIADIEVREGITIIRMARAGFVILDTGFVTWRTPSSASPTSHLQLTGNVAGTEITLLLRAADANTQFLLTAGPGVALNSTAPGAKPKIMVLALDGQERRHVEVDSSGNLFVAAAAIPKSDVIDETTGERLDLSRAVRLGELSFREHASDSCRSPDGIPRPCQARIYVNSLDAPAAGSVAYQAGELVFQDSSGLAMLRFRCLSTVGAVCPDPPVHGDVKAGGELAASGWFVISASDETGKALSVVVSDDGTVWVGNIASTVGCPCFVGGD